MLKSNFPHNCATQLHSMSVTRVVQIRCIRDFTWKKGQNMKNSLKESDGLYLFKMRVEKGLWQHRLGSNPTLKKDDC